MGRKPILPDENGVFTEKQLEKLKARALNSAVWHINNNPQTEYQIREKLRKKIIPADIIEATVVKLIKVGYLDDRSYAENFIYSKRKYEKLGVSAIKTKLYQKGIDKGLIDELLSEIDADDLRETAVVLAEKKMRSLSREPDRQKRISKVVSFLAYRGYSANIAYDVAKEVVNRNAENDADADELVE
jgi:regulatory protein